MSCARPHSRGQGKSSAGVALACRMRACTRSNISPRRARQTHGKAMRPGMGSRQDQGELMAGREFIVEGECIGGRGLSGYMGYMGYMVICDTIRQLRARTR